MEKYVFNLPTDNGNLEAVVEQVDECYAVHLNGKYAGNMWQDENKGMQWETRDTDLEPYVWEIAANLYEAFSRKGFPALLRGTYSEISQTNWVDNESLEVVLSAQTDLENFSSHLQKEVLNLVTFEEHLDLILKKENGHHFITMGVN